MSNSKLFHIFYLFLFFTTFSSSASLNRTHKCSAGQSEALLLFKHSLSSINYTDGRLSAYCQEWYDFDYYPIMMDWNTSIDCCNWEGVYCDPSTGDVIILDVRCAMLKGTIHPNSSLFNLPSLERLDLAFNDFTGSQLPPQIGRFSNRLTHLQISNCGFSGQVPTEITLLHKLVSLDLSNNDLDLKLEPHVFIDMIQNFTSLEQLSLGWVNISTVLPTSLNISSSLKFLNLQSTGLQGKLPRYIFEFHNLEKLYLSLNHFTGNIPSEIMVNLTHLTNLDLSDNKLNGTLPSWLFASPSLEFVSLGDNMLSGKVPFQLFFRASLKYLILRDNQLHSQIDVLDRVLIGQTFQQLTNLSLLDLSNNDFRGDWELDTLLTRLTNLEYLDLSYNSFSVTTKNGNHYVNPDFSFLNLASCNLKVFPKSLRAMKKLKQLDLSNNKIHGRIPLWAGELGGNNHLYYVNLSYNCITGLPQFQWYGLWELYLQSNQIEGPFPPSICNMSDLEFLDLHNNSFGGVIPQCFGKLTSSLELVDLGTNHFRGSIPNVSENCTYLEGIILKGNQLQGQVPMSLSNCEILKVLDLGNNHLNGTFPVWLEELPNLRVLVLKSNRFHGPIVASSTIEFPFRFLRVLDLSHNGFVGQLPAKYFQNFVAMKDVVIESSTSLYLYMAGEPYSFSLTMKGVEQDFPQLFVAYTIINLSNNKFLSEIPFTIGSLISLKVLDLSHNNLAGPIPRALGKLSELESLDLSWNQLTSEIPQSLANLTFLGFLNLSQNHLAGRIPQGKQFNTFDGNSFVGNPNLCGPPLRKKCNERPQEPQLESDGPGGDEESGFTWEVVALGYGCGTLLGLVMGYLMLSTRKVKWFNTIADATEYMILTRRKKRRYTYIGQ